MGETPAAQAFKFNTSKDSETRLAEIKELYRKIDSMHMGQRLLVKRMKATGLHGVLLLVWAIRFPPVTVDQKVQETIVATAKALGISLSNDFFHLGNLSRTITEASLTGGGAIPEPKMRNLNMS